MSLAALTQPDIAKMVEAAALLCPISYLEHVTAPFVLRLVKIVLMSQPKPPTFDLSSIPSSLPIWMGYGGNDALADISDVKHTLKELPSKPDLLYLENYGHIDFLLSVKAKEDVYDSMLAFLPPGNI
ncbi:hypothetical protein DH2020_006616 [Rehmannia glutinosa]|uniref:Triacylglycerol lipase n=1 Tax=Rehmannia glutinosa TaxID=99300 RepID=A0ABR0XJD6_REHGL